MTVLMSSPFGLSVQWSALLTNIDRTAKFYLIFIKSPEGNLLAEETVPGSTTTKDITGLRPLQGTESESMELTRLDKPTKPVKV